MSAPHEFPDDEQYLRALHEHIKPMLPAGKGYAVLFFDFGGPEGSLAWISNAQRPDMLNVMREFLRRNG